MCLFLLVIYWNHHKENDVILGRDAHFESDEEESEEEDTYDVRDLNFH
jgi:hypothetical protein